MAAVSMMNITQLLQAAEFLERREREHGYASTLPYNHDSSKSRKNKVKRLHANSSRSTHNELEKNRRAHLRNCLEQLKEMVPLETESSRHTTLGLLTNAKAFIQSLEEKETKFIMSKDQLSREQRFLQRRLEQLTNTSRRKPRQDSTGSSLASDDSEKDDMIDVIGYNSDSDISSSDLNNGSDGGLAVSSKEIIIQPF